MYTTNDTLKRLIVVSMPYRVIRLNLSCKRPTFRIYDSNRSQAAINIDKGEEENVRREK